MSPVPVIIAFGSNVGDSVAILQRGVDRLSESIQLRCVSALVRSAPMYITDQPAFVNGVVSAETDLGPLALLALLKSTEVGLGRRHRERNGPREIDLDIIAYGSLALRSPYLEIPHPRLAERRFVLLPLAEIAADVVLPGLPPVVSLLSATEHQARSVQPISDAALSIPSPG